MTARENSIIPRLELAMKSINASSRQYKHSIVPDQHKKDFSGDLEGRQ